MDINAAFPSKYLKAADLQKRRHVLTIDRVVQEEGIDKPIMYFQGAQKGMALNKTNAMLIASLYGNNTDRWGGQRIELYEAQVSFNNQFVPAIRVMAPAEQMPAHQSGPLPAETRPVHPAPDPNAPSDFQQPSQHGPAPQGAVSGIDDEIPF